MTAGDDVYDDILLKLGGLGRHQRLILTGLCIVIMLHSATHIAYVFTSMDSEQRCLIPECENDIKNNSELLRELVPFNNLDKPTKCFMYNRTIWDDPYRSNCSSFLSDKNTVVKCKSYYFYDEEYFLAKEYNLLCEDKRLALSLVGSVNTVGMLLGLLVSGFISDIFGRKRLLLLGISGCGAVGLIKTLSPTFQWFLSFELIEAILSAGTCGCVFIMAVELVVPKKRAFVGSVLNTCYTLGEVLVAMLAWSSKNWRYPTGTDPIMNKEIEKLRIRTMVYLTYGPCAFLIMLYWLIPESIRWKLSKGRIEETKEELREIAKMNDKDLSEDTLNKLDYATDAAEPSVSFLDIFKSSRLYFRLNDCCYGWMTCAFLFYGLTLNAVSLYGNKYMDFILICLTELPAYWCCNYFVEKIGRRASICASYLITMISCICFIFTPESSQWIYLFVYCMGKFGATAAFYIIYIITSESFPTPIRHSVMGICSTVGRLGSITSPQIPLLSQFWGPLPMVMFATMSGAAAITSWKLPETKGVKLPDTIQSAENLR